MTIILGLIVGIVIVLVLYPVSLMLLWNWLLPIVLGLPCITYMESIGLLLLSWILLGRVNIKYDK